MVLEAGLMHPNSHASKIATLLKPKKEYSARDISKLYPVLTKREILWKLKNSNLFEIKKVDHHGGYRNIYILIEDGRDRR